MSEEEIFEECHIENKEHIIENEENQNNQSSDAFTDSGSRDGHRLDYRLGC